jgi:hypothetical protein
MTLASGTFHNTSWDEQATETFGARKITRATIAQQFDGDIVGTGTWTTLMVYADDGTAEYVGVMRIVGRIAGRDGSVVLRTDGTFDGTVARTAWTVIDGMATDGLASISGAGHSAAPHGPDGTYSFEFELA